MILVTFADLTHTGTVIDANQFPLAIGFVSAVAKSRFKDEIAVQLFKFPSEFATFLESNEPKIACFSNYMWHEELNREFGRRIKMRYPDTITIFGGPNFPIAPEEQNEFLENHPEIDFYIEGEGEVSFFELLKSLKTHDFNLKTFKVNRPNLTNLRYIDGDEFICHPLAPRLQDIEENIPSPYLLGLMDKFFTHELSPLMETSRGCPYSCTFCHAGSSYQNKVQRFSQERIAAELNYIFSKVKVPSLLLADLNWGIFKEDLATAQQLADMRAKSNWPRYVHHSTAKNQRERMAKISSILGDAIVIGATVQSTDPEVLKNVKRNNIAIEKSVEMARQSSRNGSETFTEIILCLPGDTYIKHIKSILTMMDAGMDEVAIYQFILLPGTEAADNKSRRRLAYDTRFRVMPRCVGSYQILGENIPIFEVHEVCVGNSTMPFEDYKRCRRFSLTISVFNNGNIFEEIYGLAAAYDIPRSRIIMRIHELAMQRLKKMYKRFDEDEERNFFCSREAIKRFLSQPNAVQLYVEGEYGKNQIYAFRASALINCFKKITEIAIDAVQQELELEGLYNSKMQTYLDELKDFIFLKKSDLFNLEVRHNFNAQFDFYKIQKKRFIVRPENYRINKTQFEIGHTEDKISDLKKYFAQYGSNVEGLSYFIHRHPARLLYRRASRITVRDANVAALVLNKNKINSNRV